ncbi:MAG: aminotransferase class I/II-fold pyridoxal phosphate-dependent enzyme [Nitrospiraceae bacterium]|nr:MAG: aminotransferase class I/II-fold pyridoxal phosphate-dependent enzyme [Nitrospiraceae bacterium]
MNPLAQELNNILNKGNPHFLGSLASFGREIFFPKGILTQSAEAKAKAHRFNATIGTAKEKGQAMHLKSIMDHFNGLTPDEILNYAPSYGVPALRTAWAGEMVRKNPGLKGKQMSLPVVTAGLTHGLSVAADMFIEPGDDIIMPDKLWGNYRLIFELRKGAKIKTFPLYSENGGFNISGYRQVLQEAKGGNKLVTLLNFPNNPTGYTPTHAEMKEIASLLISIADTGKPVIVLCDDAYFGLFYEEDTASESVFSLLAGSHPKLTAVKLDGATKEDFVWGFRVGFITVSTGVNTGLEDEFFQAVEKKLGGTVRSNISNAPALSQSVLLHAMENSNFENERDQKRQILKERALEVKRVLSDPKYEDYFTAYPFNSGYFMCVKLKQGLDAETFRKQLLEKEGIGVIAIGSSDIRIAFSSVEKENINDLFDAMFRCASNM